MNPDGDENQNNLAGAPNADPTQQAIFTPAQTPAPEPPRPAQNSSTIVGSVVEPASTGLSHQYYSNHPTKTSASGVGDIVVGNKSNKKLSFKKPLIIGAAVLAIVVIMAIIITILSSMSNADKTIATLFNDYNTTVQDAQTIFVEARREKLTIDDIFNEQFSNKLSEYLDQLKEFNSSIVKIKPSQVSASARDDFTSVQQEIIKFVNSYQDTVALFNKLYESYITDNSSILAPLSEDENYSVAVLAERFETYFERKQKLAEDISVKHCSMNIVVDDIPSTECEYLVSEYRENLSSLQNSTVVVRTIFSAYDETIYSPQSELIYQTMQKVTQKLSKSEEGDE